MTSPVIPTITLTQAAHILGVSRRTVVRWVETGLLKAAWVGSRIKTTEEWISDAVKPVEIKSSERQEPAKPRRKESKNDEETFLERALRAREVAAAIDRS